jgi:hypothetical protein
MNRLSSSTSDVFTGSRPSLLLRNLIKRGGGGNNHHNNEELVIEELLHQPSLQHLVRLVEKDRSQDVIRIFNSEDDAVIVKWLNEIATDDNNNVTIQEAQESPSHYSNVPSVKVQEQPQPQRTPRRVTVLHQILPHQPPVELVDLICKALTRICSISVPEDMVDERGATPLHIAAAQMCDATVIRRLLQGPTLQLPAVTLDRTGRTALHWVCAAPWSQPNQNNNSNSITAGLFWGVGGSTPARDTFFENKLEIIKILLAAHPFAKVIRDEDHRLPRDLARSLHAEPILVRALSPTEDEWECCTGLLQTISLEIGNGICDISRGFEIHADPENDVEELSFHGETDDRTTANTTVPSVPSSSSIHLDDPLKLSVPMELELVREKIHTGLRASFRRDDSAHLNKYSPSA